MRKRYAKGELERSLRRVAKRLRRVPTMAEFCRAAGVSIGTIHNRFGNWPTFVRTAGLTVPEERPEQVDPAVLEAERDARMRTRRDAEALIKSLKGRVEEAEARSALLSAMTDAPPPPPLRVLPGKPGPLPDAAYVMLASDWHVGERVRPEMVGHRNEYRPDIAQERAHQFFRSQLKMLKVARSAWSIEEGVLWLGGDLITGYIHEEYEEDNFLSPVEESLLAFDLLVQGIDYLLAESDLKRIIIPTSNGNHGRTGKKVRVATYARNSFEWMLYRLLAAHYGHGPKGEVLLGSPIRAPEPRLEFRIATGYHNVVDLYGFRVRFQHGDALKYGGGVGGISIPLLRRMGRQALAGEHVDLDVLGHFHAYQPGQGYVVNGSLIGWNAFAEWIGARYERPLQASFVVDSRYHLVSNLNPILVQK